MAATFSTQLTALVLAANCLLMPGLSTSSAIAQEWAQMRSSRSGSEHDHHSRTGRGHHSYDRNKRDTGKGSPKPYNYSSERHDRRHRHHDGGFFGDGPLPDHIPGLGTFAGSISAVRDPGNGIYFYFNGTSSPYRPIVIPGNPKIITVTPHAGAAACEAAGPVCIIRP